MTTMTIVTDQTLVEMLRGPYQRAYRLLHLGFIALPIVAGIDKFFNWLCPWEQYLAPAVANRLPMDPAVFMRLGGLVEIAAGVLVAFRPRLGGYVVAGWLWAIIANLLLSGTYYDIALRDIGLSLGALALAALSSTIVVVRSGGAPAREPADVEEEDLAVHSPGGRY